MNQILKYGIYTGLFATLFIPLIIADGFFFPFITGKAFTFRIIVEIIFALWLILAFKDSSVRPRGSTMLYALLAFIASLGISTILAEDPSKAFWSNFERMEGYISLLHFGAYFLVASTMLSTQKLWKRFWNTSIIASVLVALYGVFQLAGLLTINQGGVRVDATFGNATYLAVYMLFNFFITLMALAAWKPHRYMQLFYVFALVLQGSMIFYTATRGTILGLVGGLLLSGLIFVVFAKGQKTLRTAGAALAASIIILAGIFFMIKDTALVQNNDVLTRIASISLEEGETRFTIWSMAYEGFKDRPLFGWGQEGFSYVFSAYYNPSLYAQEPWFDRAHNIFFDWLIAGGIFGFLLYLALFATALWYLWKPGNAFTIGERAIITGLLAGYGFHNLFVFDNLMSYVLFLSLLSYLTTRSLQNNETAPIVGGTKTVDKTALPIAALAVGVVFVAVFWMANVPGMARASGIIDAIRPYEEGLTKNFDEFKGIVKDGGMGRQEAHEQLVQFAAQIRSTQLADRSTPEFRNEVAMFAIDEFNEVLEHTPNNARLHMFFGSFLRQLGVYDQATEHIETAHELSPGKQSILFERALIELDQGNTEEALQFFKEAYELEPAYDRARIFYAATAIRADKQERADQLLIERYGTVDIDNSILLQAYIDTNQHEKVIAFALRQVENNPEDAQRWLELAAAYLNANQRTNAIEAIQKAIELNPQFKTQGEQYISDIRAGRPLQ
ncbi:MAG: O-antigen ligase family protein [Patescibacteria group bacterium UBA2163]